MGPLGKQYSSNTSRYLQLKITIYLLQEQNCHAVDEIKRQENPISVIFN